MSRKITIDKTDVSILEQLQVDASLNNKELAKIIGLTPPPTLSRINTLKEKGYILSKLLNLNWEILGFTYQAQVLVSIDQIDQETFESLVLSTDGVRRLEKMRKEEIIDTKAAHYIAYCVFSDEEKFLAAWDNIIDKCHIRVDFQVWVVDRNIVDGKAIPITTLNSK